MYETSLASDRAHDLETVVIRQESWPESPGADAGPAPEPATMGEENISAISVMPQDTGGSPARPLTATAVGFVVAASAAALWFWIAWLLSHQPAPWNDRAGPSAWLTHTDGSAWLAATAATALLLLAVAAVVGGVVGARAWRDSTEAAHAIAGRAEDEAHRVGVEMLRVAGAREDIAVLQLRLTTEGHTLALKSHSLDLDRHQLAIKHRADDYEHKLRSRLAIIVDQLASSAFAVRTAGAYALVALAEDWHRFGRDDERQVCVSLLCGLLRSRTSSDDPADADFRCTVIGILAGRRRDVSQEGWTACSLDLTNSNLTGAGLARVNLARTVLVGVDLTGADLTGANLEGSDLRGATLNHASLAGATLVGADLSGADLTGANLRTAELTNCRLTRATLTNADLQGASLNGIDFTDTILTGADLSGVRLTDARVLESLAAPDASAAPDGDPPRESPAVRRFNGRHHSDREQPTPPATPRLAASLTEARPGR